MIEEVKFYTCKYDRAFKEVFLKEDNQDILKELLRVILNVEIEKIEYNNVERNTGNLKIKRKYFDCILTTDKGEIEIELNATTNDYLHPRNMSYICDMYASHTVRGDNTNKFNIWVKR